MRLLFSDLKTKSTMFLVYYKVKQNSDHFKRKKSSLFIPRINITTTTTATNGRKKTIEYIGTVFLSKLVERLSLLDAQTNLN